MRCSAGESANRTGCVELLEKEKEKESFHRASRLSPLFWKSLWSRRCQVPRSSRLFLPNTFTFPRELTRLCQLLVARRGRDRVEVIEHPVRVSLSFRQRRKDFFIRGVSE